MRSKNFDDAFARLAAAEQQFAGSEFLAPVVARGEVQVRIAGVLNRLRVTPASFTGFGVFAAISTSQAKFVRAATLAERQKYLSLFPLVRLILVARAGQDWLAIAAHRGDARFQIAGVVPVWLCAEVQPFDVVRARFDGGNFWFEALETRRDPATAAYLRAQLAAQTRPNLLERSGLTAEERAAYALHFVKEEAASATSADEATGDPAARLREALAHAGAELVGYLERNDSYRVTYRVGGVQHTSAVNKDNLNVQVAGICLSGRDGDFDLASLVGVLRQAEGEEHVVPIGEHGLAEEDYWRVHPPRNR